MAQSDDRLKVFISYARRDASTFAEDLKDGLEIGGFDAFLDREDIAPGEDWEKRLDGLIAEADTVIFVISPASIASERCGWELSRAEALSKRILPVVAADVPDGAAPDILAKRNYVYFSGGRPFGRSLKQLVAALNTDLDWIREHTRLGDLAARWMRHDRSASLLLRGPELAAAEQWLAAGAAGAEPTEGHRAFIEASALAAEAEAKAEIARQGEVAQMQAHASRRNLIFGSLAVGGLAAGGALVWKLIEASQNSVDGLVEREAQRTDITGQLIAYAASPGTNLPVKYDRSTFSAVLLPKLNEPNKSMTDALTEVQGVVRQASPSYQSSISSSLNGDIFLNRQPASRRLVAYSVSVTNPLDKSNYGGTHLDGDEWAARLGELGFPVTRVKDPTVADLDAMLGAMHFDPAESSVSVPILGRARIVTAAVKLPVVPLAANALALFYFSGFGIIQNGKNYLCSVDAELDGHEQPMSALLRLDDLFRQLRLHAAASIVILDAQFGSAR